MKTKKLIKILQDADPSGECHVRLLSGDMDGDKCGFYTEHKPDYYDGPYSYLKGDWGNDMV